ncbi:MAG: hypothetical protein OEX02_18510 [Cyclobacteriaceae bacterium]|nr:hypothetical protein [Cyclobacteriaceae bacterium]
MTTTPPFSDLSDHLIRLDCVQAVPSNLLNTIPRSCLYRWKKEPPDIIHRHKGWVRPIPLYCHSEGQADAAVFRPVGTESITHPPGLVHPLAGRFA